MYVETPLVFPAWQMTMVHDDQDLDLLDVSPVRDELVDELDCYSDRGEHLEELLFITLVALDVDVEVGVDEHLLCVEVLPVEASYDGVYSAACGP